MILAQVKQEGHIFLISCFISCARCRLASLIFQREAGKKCAKDFMKKERFKNSPKKSRVFKMAEKRKLLDEAVIRFLALYDRSHHTFKDKNEKNQHWVMLQNYPDGTKFFEKVFSKCDQLFFSFCIRCKYTVFFCRIKSYCYSKSL